jgi:hypothetical protein
MAAKIVPDDEPAWSEFRVHDDGQEAVPLIYNQSGF